MSRKFSSIFVSVTLLVSALAMATPSIALAAGGGPADAENASGTWTALNMGQQTWYGFSYAGDGSQILARMGVVPSTGATFSVFTPAQVQQWEQGNNPAPVGMGSANSAFGGDLVWAGNFNTPGIYYIRVDQAGGAPSNYALTVSGSGVTPLATPKAAVKAASDNEKTEKNKADEKAAAVKTATTTTTTTTTDNEKTEKNKADEKAAAAKTAAAKTGLGPAQALTADGKWTTLPAGKTIWYAIPYAGDGSQLIIQMGIDSNNPASFAVWTPDEIAAGGPDGGVQPIGRGSPDPSLGGSLAWSGNFNTPGTYYVTVTGNGTPAGYQLTVQ